MIVVGFQISFRFLGHRRPTLKQILGLVNCLWFCLDDKGSPFGLEWQRGIPCDLAN